MSKETPKYSNTTPSYGGQAVVEGVMMRGVKHFAIVCRRMNGELVSTLEPVETYMGKFGHIKAPFLRGIVALADSMILGMKSIHYSSDIAMTDQLEEETKQKAAELESKINENKDENTVHKSEKELKKLAKKKEKNIKEMEQAKAQLEGANNKVNGILIGASAFVGFAIAIVLFMLVPIFASKLVTNTIFNISTDNKWAFSLIEGVFKLGIFLLYVWGISFIPDIKRIFQYHGAEHKTINAFEAGKELNIENIKKESTIHTRCGTSFILILISITIIVFCFIPNDNIIGRFALKLLLLPFIASVSYEVIKLSAKYSKSIITRIFLAPGLFVQKITTKEPDEKMIECAMTSLKLVMNAENTNDVAEINTEKYDIKYTNKYDNINTIEYDKIDIDKEKKETSSEINND